MPVAPAWQPSLCHMCHISCNTSITRTLATTQKHARATQQNRWRPKKDPGLHHFCSRGRTSSPDNTALTRGTMRRGIERMRVATSTPSRLPQGLTWCLPHSCVMPGQCLGFTAAHQPLLTPTAEPRAANITVDATRGEAAAATHHAGTQTPAYLCMHATTQPTLNVCLFLLCFASPLGAGSNTTVCAQLPSLQTPLARHTHKPWVAAVWHHTTLRCNQPNQTCWEEQTASIGLKTALLAAAAHELAALQQVMCATCHLVLSCPLAGPVTSPTPHC